MLLTRDQPVASYFIRIACIFLLCVSMLLFMFIPKMRLMASPPASNRPSRMTVLTQPRTTARQTFLPNEREEIYKHRISELESMLEELTPRRRSSTDIILDDKTSESEWKVES